MKVMKVMEVMKTVWVIKIQRQRGIHIQVLGPSCYNEGKYQDGSLKGYTKLEEVAQVEKLALSKNILLTFFFSARQRLHAMALRLVRIVVEVTDIQDSFD